MQPLYTVSTGDNLCDLLLGTRAHDNDVVWVPCKTDAGVLMLRLETDIYEIVVLLVTDVVQLLGCYGTRGAL